MGIDERRDDGDGGAAGADDVVAACALEEDDDVPTLDVGTAGVARRSGTGLARFTVLLLLPLALRPATAPGLLTPPPEPACPEPLASGISAGNRAAL